ncbi:hypothetical protein BCR34DRAFT_285384 [Clohesyomyces aquaticus]|uniref:Glutathione S-transferase n=1 Tax=Clohesyomyces aquaticus TaxID=1231657 RepID=A0A1Y1ZRG4_9PLEO|nr:hypothetical protein BCR34DRAFT_285384 [Clohesyomyces aquaticus]
MSSQPPTAPPTLHLYTSLVSSSAARIHIALFLKEIACSTTHFSLSDPFPATFQTLNPGNKVPVLSITQPTSSTTNPTAPTLLSQSPAILTYLEENFPSRPLIPIPSPSTWIQRAKIHELVSLIACDIQPPTNQSIVLRVRALCPDPPPNTPSGAKIFAQNVMREGLLVYNTLISSCSGRYSVGDEVTLADVCLVPAVQMAELYDVDVRGNEGLREVARVYDECMKMWEFREGSRREGVEKVHVVPHPLEENVEA